MMMMMMMIIMKKDSAEKFEREAGNRNWEEEAGK